MRGYLDQESLIALAIGILHLPSGTKNATHEVLCKAFKPFGGVLSTCLADAIYIVLTVYRLSPPPLCEGVFLAKFGLGDSRPYVVSVCFAVPSTC